MSDCTPACPSGCTGYHYELSVGYGHGGITFGPPPTDYTVEIYDGAIKLLTAGLVKFEDAIPMADALLRDAHALAQKFHGPQQDVDED